MSMGVNKTLIWLNLVLPCFQFSLISYFIYLGEPEINLTANKWNLNSELFLCFHLLPISQHALVFNYCCRTPNPPPHADTHMQQPDPESSKFGWTGKFHHFSSLTMLGRAHEWCSLTISGGYTFPSINTDPLPLLTATSCADMHCLLLLHTTVALLSILSVVGFIANQIFSFSLSKENRQKGNVITLNVGKWDLLIGIRTDI